jgi:hypothetical protein
MRDTHLEAIGGFSATPLSMSCRTVFGTAALVLRIKIRFKQIRIPSGSNPDLNLGTIAKKKFQIEIKN